jgi:trimeric autotransporter adhesin
MHALRRLFVVVVSALALVLAGAPAHAVEYSTVPDPATSWKSNGRVYDVMAVGDRVYIAGEFSRVRSLVTGRWSDRERLAAFDRTTGALLPWNPGADGTVRALAAGDDGVVYAGGLFTTAGGASNSRLAAFDASGASLSTFVAWVNGEVRDLAFDDGALYLSGGFGTVNGSPRRAVAKVDAVTGAVDRAFNARVGSGRVNAIKVEGDELVIGGSFVGLAGAPTQFLAAVALDTGTSVGPAFPIVCETCTIFDLDTNTEGAGTFVYAATGGGGGGRVVKWSLSSGQRLWLRSGDGDAQAIDVFDQTVYVGGHFGPTFFGQPRRQLAVLTTAGVLLPMSVPFTGKDKPGLWAVEADARGLLLGGGFQGIEGSEAANFAVLPAR